MSEVAHINNKGSTRPVEGIFKRIGNVIGEVSNVALDKGGERTESLNQLRQALRDLFRK